MDMTPERWQATNAYIREVFGREDERLSALMTEAREAGLPDIAISADVGRLLKMLALMVNARLAIEVGTLGGYSAIWIARGLTPGGRLITIECESKHAEFAQRQFDLAQLNDCIELKRGEALDVLEDLRNELPDGAVNMFFLDAEKTEYPAYWKIIRPMIAPGGIVVVDNALGAGSWWIDHRDHPARAAIDRVNRTMADDPEFEAIAVPLRQGVLVGRRTAERHG